MRRRLGTSVGLMLAAAVPSLALLVLAELLPWTAGFGHSWITRLEPERWYALETAGTEATFDLPFDGAGEYLLVVGNLATGEVRGSVLLSAETVETAAPIAGRDLEPLRALIEADRRSRTRNAASLPLREIATISVPARASGSPAAFTGGATDERTFHLHVTDGPLDDPRHYARIDALAIAEGQTVRVYLDRRMRSRDLIPGLADEIVRLMDDEVVPRSRRFLGAHRDVDGDGRFAILLTPWLDKLQGGRTSLGGMVRGDDFRTDREPPFGNRADLMFLNASLKPDAHLRTLLIHEYAHAICFSARLGSDVASIPLPPEEDWLNEAIAHLAEHEHEGGWSNLDHRISRFLDDPAAAPLVVPDYFRAGLWREHACRGATFLFLRWCADQFGNDLPARLTRAPYAGIRNLEHATGVPFEELYRRWTVALATTGHTEHEAAAAGDGYRTVRVDAPLAGWGLIGPRTDLWDVDADRRAIDLRGTASAFIRLRASNGPGPRRIHVRATPGMQLQLSLQKVAVPAPDLRMAARWTSAGSDAAGAVEVRTAGRRLAIELTVAGREGGDPLEVEFIACEINRADKSRTHCLRGDELRAVIAHRPARDLENHLRGWRLELPVPFLVTPDEAVVVKAIVRDQNGNRWPVRAEVEPFGRPAATDLAAVRPESASRS